MVLRQPSIRRKMAYVIAALFPITMVGIAAARCPNNEVTLPAVGLFGGLFGFATGVAWVLGRRDVALSRDFIQLRGLWGHRIPWTKIEKVEGFVLPKRSFVIFTGKNGKAIAVDSTLYGWEEFVEKAPELARDAGPSLLEAIRRVEGTPR